MAESDLIFYKELNQQNYKQIQSFVKCFLYIFNGNTAPLLIKITPDKTIPVNNFAIQRWKGTIGDHCISINDLFPMFAQLKKANNKAYFTQALANKLYVNRHEFTIKKLNFVKSVHNLSIARFNRPRKQITYKQIIFNARDIGVEKTESAIPLEGNTIISLVERHNDVIWNKKRNERPEENR